MAHLLSVTDMARNLAEYINRVSYRGEVFTIIRGKKQVAELKPVLKGRPLADLPHILTSLPRLTNKERGAFSKDLRHIKRSSNQSSVRDPWES